MRKDLHIAALAAALTSSACGSSEPNLPPPGDVGGDVGTVVGGPATPPATALPPLPTLTNVVTRTTGDSVRISFDPFDGAADYRVYVLPADGDIDAAADGQLTI